jgi:hypothetical protein
VGNQLTQGTCPDPASGLSCCVASPRSAGALAPVFAWAHTCPLIAVTNGVSVCLSCFCARAAIGAHDDLPEICLRGQCADGSNWRRRNGNGYARVMAAKNYIAPPFKSYSAVVTLIIGVLSR